MASQTMTEPTTISTTQSSIRNAMSFSNLLSKPKSAHDAAIEVSTRTKTPVLEPPSTPKRSPSPIKNETASPADTIMSEFTEVGTGGAAGDGTGTVIDDDDLIEREFTCMNDEYTKCRTGQYTKVLSRKVISDHFGRNKACTRDLEDWPLFCRKHYQRATYNKELWQVRKVKLILRQFDVIENEFPGTTYDVTLKKSEEDRLNDFSRKIAGGMSAEEAAAAVAPMTGKAFEAPIDVLRELDQYIGKGKTMQKAKDAMDVVLQMLQEKETDQVPSIEFLPKLSGKMSTPKKSSAKTCAAKSPSESPSESPSKGSPRTSAHGAIKKTNKKA